ncbi:MAG: cysteine hydrolase [Clostridiales bacterium]|nr:cysteine hydrolase [Clostridiales bacterium]
MLEFDRDRTALVIVDMQNDFVREGAAMEVPDARKTIPAIQNLIEMARQCGMPVIYTKFVAGPKRTFLWEWSPQIPDDNCCIRGFKREYNDAEGELECTDIIGELYPERQDYVFEKYNYSAFRNSPLKDILLGHHCDALIVTGTVTHLCVCDTVHDAAQEHFKVLVASDGVSSYSDLQQEASLESFHTKYGVVETSGEIIKRFSGE